MAESPVHSTAAHSLRRFSSGTARAVDDVDWQPLDMSEDRPLTRPELREELTALAAQIRSEFVTKADLRQELAALGTKICAEMHADIRHELEAQATQLRAETNTGLQGLRTEMATGFAEMRAYIDFSVKSSRDELRTHFDVVAENFRSEFRPL